VPDAPARIVWDHSAVGDRVVVPVRPRVSIALEPDGVYEFQALPELVRAFPAAGADALRYAADGS
jgi:hypothetical protein